MNEKKFKVRNERNNNNKYNYTKCRLSGTILITSNIRNPPLTGLKIKSSTKLGEKQITFLNLEDPENLQDKKN